VDRSCESLATARTRKTKAISGSVTVHMAIHGDSSQCYIDKAPGNSSVVIALHGTRRPSCVVAIGWFRVPTGL
jgi:hypothetical protein